MKADTKPRFINNTSPEDVAIAEQFYGVRKTLRVAMIGAGVSGLNFLKLAEEKLDNVNIICYEKNSDIGGAWYENRYPGCACGIPSVVYQFPWRPAPWSQYYSHSPEIWKYLKMVEQENNFVDKYVKLRHRVNALEWSDDTAQWSLRLIDRASGKTFNDHAHVIINGSGLTSKYDERTDLTGKRVALLGAGSSAVQILPNIYDKVDRVYTWQRRLFDDSDEYLVYRELIEAELSQRFGFIVNGSSPQAAADEFADREMRNKLSSHPDLLEKIMPRDVHVGCRRPTPGNGYLERLSGPKTVAYTTQLHHITRNGFIDPDGTEQAVDVIELRPRSRL
ncbi:hypothetical protein Z517_03550 [Fonsecaea pedrosoi CBS 271.37]|uniref:L-ornithine N(5)-oxygenase n=1 Tax=Fonsecaea pedrosoi CBS 271.37 TaxID=1442368 RepID=A0A0D2H091_9EURO|nr:uncharacterized protein Z517_03550 [Fonsecaea pedrosoi CBS 271.37]KIW84300.1 hypothetical protein Z517_03550 [Fonsecaea pedrosoi CBS 271.37]